MTDMRDDCARYIANIVVNIAEKRGVAVDKLMAGDKVRSICATRYMIYAYLHNELGISANKIGKYFNKPRRSILRGIQILKGWVQYHLEIQNEYNSIVEQLKGGN